eukprot:s348_g1.t1
MSYIPSVGGASWLPTPPHTPEERWKLLQSHLSSLQDILMSVTVMLDLREAVPLGYFPEDTEELEKGKYHLSAAIKLLELQVALAKCRKEEAHRDSYGAQLQQLARKVLESMEQGRLTAEPHWPLWAPYLRELLLNQAARQQKVCVACNSATAEQGKIHICPVCRRTLQAEKRPPLKHAAKRCTMLTPTGLVTLWLLVQSDYVSECQRQSGKLDSQESQSTVIDFVKFVHVTKPREIHCRHACPGDRGYWAPSTRAIVPESMVMDHTKILNSLD